MIFSEEIVDVDEGADEVYACQENSKNDVYLNIIMCAIFFQ